MKKSISLRVATVKPRNPFALLAGMKSSGRHRGKKREKSVERKDLLQRLREAGL